MQEFEAQSRIFEQCKTNAILTPRAQKLYWVSGLFSNFCPQASTLLCLDWSQSTYRHHADVLWIKHVICFKGIFCFYFFPLSLWPSSCPVPFYFLPPADHRGQTKDREKFSERNRVRSSLNSGANKEKMGGTWMEGQLCTKETLSMPGLETLIQSRNPATALLGVTGVENTWDILKVRCQSSRGLKIGWSQICLHKISSRQALEKKIIKTLYIWVDERSGFVCSGEY